MNFNNMNVLIFMLAKREKYRDVMFSKNEVFCGPDCVTERTPQGYKSIQTPVGLYDVQEIINLLPKEQYPDLIVVKADSTNRNYPVNLSSVSCPKVLIIGGTHNLFPPIRSIMLYAKQENFDFYCSDHNRHHLHFFVDLGFKNVFWAPALNLNPHSQPFRLTRKNEAAFVGNMGKFHPFRHKTINFLRQKSVPMNVCQAKQADAANIYGKTDISLNCSLNGDMNLRVFEIISSSGFLLTDKLSDESGINMLFEDGVHYKSYSCNEELLELSCYFLGNPGKAQEIAQNGLRRYQSILRPEDSINRFYSYVFDGELDDMYCIESRCKSITKSKSSFERVAIYEFFQDLQLKYSERDIALSDKVRSLVSSDIHDLNKLNLIDLDTENAVADLLVIHESEIDALDFDKLFKKQPFLNLTVLSSDEKLSDPSVSLLRKKGLKRSRKNENYFELKSFNQISKTLPLSLYTKLLLQIYRQTEEPSVVIKLIERYIAEQDYITGAELAKEFLANDRANTQVMELLKSIQQAPEDYELLNSPFEFKNKNLNNGRLKILLVTNLFPPQEFGGYGRLMADFSMVLKAMGHDVYTLTSHSPQFGDIPNNEPGIFRGLQLSGGWKDGKTFTFPESRSRMIAEKNSSVLRTHIRAFSPDVCLLGNIDCLGMGVLQELLNHNIPVVHHIGGGWPGYPVEAQPKSPLYVLGCASRWVQTELKKRGYNTSQSTVIYPGAVVDYFNFSASPVFDKLRIAFAGIVLPYKGPHLLINSLAALKREGYDFTCEIAGTTTDQNYIDQLKQFVTSQSLSKQIKFTGFLNRQEMRKLLGRNNTLVFPTIVDEAFGISQVEAMAAGLCVSSSGTGGACEVIENNVNGLLFERDNYGSLTESLRKLADNQDLAASLAKQGKQDALKIFDIKTSTELLVKEFKKLLQLIEPLTFK